MSKVQFDGLTTTLWLNSTKYYEGNKSEFSSHTEYFLNVLK